MYRALAALIAGAALAAGCGGQQASAPEAAGIAPAPETTEALPQPNYDIPMRNFAPVKIGPYEVQPMFEEEIEDGHFNIKITNGVEFKAVRIWVGPENAGGVMVVKAEVENDYQHGHVEVPAPVPADAKLWIEIENPAGETFKGSTPLKAAA